MDFVYANAAILPILTMVFISNSIRDSKTGTYLGYLNTKTFCYAIGILIVEAYFMTNEHGFNVVSIARAVFISSLPFIGAYIFVRYTHKENYGVEFGSSKHKDS